MATLSGMNEILPGRELGGHDLGHIEIGHYLNAIMRACIHW